MAPPRRAHLPQARAYLFAAIRRFTKLEATGYLTYARTQKAPEKREEAKKKTGGSKESNAEGGY